MKAYRKRRRRTNILIVIVNFIVAISLIGINIYIHSLTTIEVKAIEGKQVVEVVNSYADYFTIIAIGSVTILICTLAISVCSLLYENKKAHKRLQSLVCLFDEVGLSKITDYDPILTDSDIQVIEAWNRSVAEIDYINELREKYFKNMVHDLKSPLQILSMNVQMLKLAYPDDEFVLGIEDELEILEKSVSNYLMVEKITFFERVEKTNINIEAYFQKIKDRYSRLNHHVVVFDKSSDHYIKSDENMFNRIIENIIENSIKYGINNRIDIEVGDGYIKFANDIAVGVEIPDIFSQERHYSIMGNGLGVEIINTYIKLLEWSITSKTVDNKFVVLINSTDK